MALDKNKIIAEATKLVQKGAFDKAIKSYERILNEDPKDVRILLKVGELHQKKGDDRAAAGAFTRVAETYAEQGFFLKAVAVYKQIVKLDPDEVRVNERLAALYQQLGLLSDAMGQLQYMATFFERQGDATRLTDILKRMIDLDPDNIASSVKLGELYVQAGQPALSKDCFRRAAEYLKRNKRPDEYLKIAERLSSVSPDDLALTRELAHLYVNKGDTKRALAKLQLCFKADPKDLETLTLLAHAFHNLGQTAKTISVNREIAHVYEEQGKYEEARATWRKVQEAAPDDEDAAAALGPTSPPAPPIQVRRATGASGSHVEPVPLRAAIPLKPPSSPTHPPGSEAIEKLLTETDVYVKYGLHDKALDHLRKVLLLDPNCAEAHEKTRDIEHASGRVPEAASAAVKAVRSHAAKGALEKAQEALARVREIDPRHPEFSELSALAAGISYEEAVLLEPEAEEAPEELALSVAGQGDDESEAEPVESKGREPPRVEEARAGEIGAGGDALAEAAAIASAESEEVAEEPERTAPSPSVTPPVKPPSPALPRAVIIPPPTAVAFQNLKDELEEAEFLVQQGLSAEAREMLQALLDKNPGHPEVTAHLAALPREEATQEKPSKVRPPPPALGTPRPSPNLVAEGGGDESFDIARELAEELGSDTDTSSSVDEFQYSVEDVFSQFKKGVAETVRPEDSATHYDLGIAYKEMGLIDDAVGEFETALRDRKREVDCLSMMGICRLAQGRAKDAIQMFRRALSSDYLGKDAVKAVHFELAHAYEAAGDKEAALFVLQKVARADPNYREVGRRIAALGNGPGRPPSDERPAPGSSASASTPRPEDGSDSPEAGGASNKKNIGYL